MNNIEQERNSERKRQIKDVMPLISKLLMVWSDLPKWICIEKEEKYCEISKNRIKEHLI